MIQRVAGGALGPLLTSRWDGSAYVVRGRDRAVLIDAGAGLPPLEPPPGVDELLLTHLHLDHAGGAAALADRGLRVRAHPWTTEGLRAGDEERAGLTTARHLYPVDARLRACPVDDLLPDTTLDLGGCTVTAIDTPGHADGHLAFLVVEPSGHRTLLAGDLVFAGGRVALQELPDCRPAALEASLRRVRALAPDRLLAGHGEPVERGAVAHLDLALAAFAAGELPPPLVP